MRTSLRLALVALLLSATASSAVGGDAKRVLVLGVDGLDPKLLQQYMDEGLLPNFKKLVAEGDFKPLQTVMPPLSPIAWSTFITGMDPGGHGVFDFIHRDAKAMTPYRAEARAYSAPKTLGIGSLEVPLSAGGNENLRKGRAFWQILDDHDVPTTLFRMPANFPPVESGGKAFSGMGTPDITGAPGVFSYYADKKPPNANDFSGGKFYQVQVIDDRVEAKLHGPKNSFHRVRKASIHRDKVTYKNPQVTVDFTVYLDGEKPIAKFEVQDQEFILQEGEWSSWIPIQFKVLPYGGPDWWQGAIESVSAIGRFYLKEVRPDFKLYVTPLQIDPANPGGMQLSTPKSWSRELYEALGRFYTQELREDTKAFTHGVLTGREFWDQTRFTYAERRKALDYFLDRFEEGLLFFYFSSIDQNSHMLWSYKDPAHPGFKEDDLLADGIRTAYRDLDEALGRVMEVVDDETTLIVMSDHGFSPFYWGVNLNTWLLEKGYVTLRDPSRQGRLPWFANVDWSRTRAYAVGLNGLYVNQAGRDRNGIVPVGERQALLDELERELLELVDPRNGQRAVTLVVQTERDFHGEHIGIGPDIIVGYNWGYRSSWKSPLGEFPEEIFEDNVDAWSGDHAMDHRVVPGVLISNRRITLDEPALYDLTVAILDEYGVAKPEQMIGRDCLGEKVSK